MNLIPGVKSQVLNEKFNFVGQVLARVEKQLEMPHLLEVQCLQENQYIFPLD